MRPVKGGYGEGNFYHFTLSWPSNFTDKSGRIPNFDSTPKLQADAERLFRNAHLQGLAAPAPRLNPSNHTACDPCPLQYKG